MGSRMARPPTGTDHRVQDAASYATSYTDSTLSPPLPAETVAVTDPAGTVAARVVNTDAWLLPDTSAPTCFTP